MSWQYSYNSNNTARYTLGEYTNPINKTLICVGINPSTATPNKLDRTLNKVKAIAMNQKYVNWIMLNVYPQRATNPSNLHKRCNKQLHNTNLNEIRNILITFSNSDILFAYGNLIDKRPYLKVCLTDILNLISAVQFSGNFYCIERTKKGNPVHPLYQKTNCSLINY